MTTKELKNRNLSKIYNPIDLKTHSETLSHSNKNSEEYHSFNYDPYFLFHFVSLAIRECFRVLLKRNEFLIEPLFLLCRHSRSCESQGLFFSSPSVLSAFSPPRRSIGPSFSAPCL